MAHRCPDGTHTKLVRTGPVGTMVGVVWDCPHCGMHKSAEAMFAAQMRVLNDPAVRAALR